MCAEWVYIWHLFFSVNHSKETQSFINFYEEGSKITGFVYIRTRYLRRNMREVTDR